MKSKICWSLLVIIILFNCIFTNFVYGESYSYSESQYEDFSESGNTSLGTVETSTSSVAGATGMVSSIFSAVISPLTLLSVFVNDGGLYRTESSYSASNVGWFNLGSLVFDEYLLFNINVSQTNSSLNSSVEGTSVSNAVDSLKQGAAGFYQISFNVAMILIFLLLIYTFIRLIASKTAADKAKFKKLITIWAKAVIFLLMSRIIIILFNIIWAKIMDILYDMKLALESAGYVSFEVVLFSDCLTNTVNYSGFQAMVFVIELIAFVIIDFIFFGKYIARSFMVFLLIVLCPIYAVIDIFKKINSQKGVLNLWFTQYLSYIFIQVWHAVIYLVFIVTLSNVAINSPLVGVLLLYALLLAEKIGQVLFGFSKETLKDLMIKD